MPKVSVIIPVYKSEPYIRKCAESLFGQTLADMEFVFVDDASPDRSIEVLEDVLDAFPDRRSQVKVIRHGKNSGLAAARITGLKNVTGDFVGCCDSDDYVDPQMYSLLLEKAESDGCDVVICNYYRTFEDQVSVKRQQFTQDALPAMMMERMSWSLCPKITLRSLYDGVAYPAGDMGEDMVLTAQTTYKAKKIGFVDRPLYYYVTYETSICNVQGKENILGRFRQSKANVDIILGFIRENSIFPENSSEVINLKYHVRMHLMRLIHEKEVYRLWRSTYPEIDWKILFAKKISRRRKLNFLAVYFRVYTLLNRSM